MRVLRKGAALFLVLSCAVVTAMPTAGAAASDTAVRTEMVSSWLREQLQPLRARRAKSARVDKVTEAALEPFGDRKLATQVREFYAKRRGRPLFFEAGELTDSGRRVVALLKGSLRHGLPSARYLADELETRMAEVPRREAALARPRTMWTPPAGWLPPTRRPYEPALREALKWGESLIERWLQAQMTVDVHLTAGALRLLSDLGAVGRKTSARKRRELLGALGRDADAALATVLPTHPDYAALGLELERYVTLLNQRQPKPLPRDASLEPGTHSAAVRLLRERLAFEGYLAEVGTGPFDDKVTEAVRAFQRSRALPPTGKVDDLTLVELERPAEWWLRRLVLALERWRESATLSHGGTFVRVNIPEFVVEVWFDGERKMRMDALVGTPKTPTYEMDTVLREMRLNPRWNVPAGVQRRIVEPRSRREPDFLEKNHFVEKKGKDGGRRFIQKPGPWNWLGRIIFPVFNRHNIALHGSLRRHLFAQERRAYSNGCVNLEDEIAFARLLLERDGGAKIGRMDSALEGWKTTRLKLRRPIPVVMEYQTVGVGEGGRARFLADIYRKDSARLSRISLDGFRR